MSLLQDILEYNARFVSNGEYEAYRTSKFPDKKLVVVTCMDTRLVELVPKAMNLRNGDAKVIKNAGAMVHHPYGEAMKSILVALYQLKAEEVMIVAHHDCGMNGLSGRDVIESMTHKGVPEAAFSEANAAGVDLNQWLTGFASVEENVKKSVMTVKNHPLLPKGTRVHGLVISPETGRLDVIVRDDEGE